MTKVLNSVETSESDQQHVDSKVLMENLNKTMTNMKSEFITENGVDFPRMLESSHFIEYKRLAEQLSAIDLSVLSQTERKTFFINIYNCLTLHALAVQSKDAQEVLDVDGLWTEYAYRIGKFCLTLDDIEHGILRCNKPHPSGKIYFTENDPKLSLVLQDFDHRIHFALNCGAKSCPPIRIYTAEKLDQQLDTAAKSFCSQECQVKNNDVLVSTIFMWYKSDFGKDDNEVKLTLAQYVLDEKVKRRLCQPETNLKFSDYNWKINSK